MSVDVGDGVRVSVGVGDGVGAGVGVEAAVGVGVGVGDGVGVGVGVEAGVAVGVGVVAGVAVGVGVGTAVDVEVAAGPCVGPLAGVGIVSRAGGGVAVAVGSTVDLAVGVAVCSGVGAGLSLQALRTTAMARTVRTASQPIRKGDTVISVVYPHVVLEFPEPGSGGLECFNSAHVSISERAVSGPKRTQDESSRFCVVGDRGLEPRTPVLSGLCSDRLS